MQPVWCKMDLSSQDAVQKQQILAKPKQINVFAKQKEEEIAINKGPISLDAAIEKAGAPAIKPKALAVEETKDSTE